MNLPNVNDETIIFYRKGFFITDNHTEHQCTSVGWKGYSYSITIEAFPILDEDGFLIDHNILHAEITKWIKDNPFPSCELTCKTLAYVVANKILEHGAKLKRLGFSVRPVDHKWLMLNDNGELVSRDKRVVDHDKPASGEYWITFKY